MWVCLTDDRKVNIEVSLPIFLSYERLEHTEFRVVYQFLEIRPSTEN